MKNKLPFFILIFTTIFFFASTPVFAFCPVCTVAVGAAAGLSRWLGIDDLITGTWIGALLVSVSLWTINWLTKKKIKFLFRKILIFSAYYLLTIVPLYWAGIMGHPWNQITIFGQGYDKLLIGMIVGTVVFSLSHGLNFYLKKKNDGKVYFPFQRVVVPVVILLITSLLFYWYLIS